VKTKNTKTAEKKAALLGVVAEGAELNTAVGGSVTDAVATWLAPEYMLMAKERMEEADGEEKFAALRVFVKDWARLRRGDFSAAKLQLKREQLDWQHANSAWQKEKEFDEWIKRPEIREKYFPEKSGGITTETFRKIEKELRLL
jgi:hypothetical protein